MKIAIVTAFPPSKVTLTEYGYHLVKHFAQKDEISEIVLITDHTEEDKQLDFETNNCKITVRDSWNFNSYKNVFSIYNTINKEKPDAILFNLQFMKFGDKKIPAALAAIIPLVLSSITIQFSLGSFDNKAACSKIAGCGLDFGKSSPLTI